MEEEVEETSIESSEGGEDKKDLKDEKTLPSEEGKQEHQGKESKSGGQLRLTALTPSTKTVWLTGWVESQAVAVVSFR